MEARIKKNKCFFLTFNTVRSTRSLINALIQYEEKTRGLITQEEQYHRNITGQCCAVSLTCDFKKTEKEKGDYRNTTDELELFKDSRYQLQ